MTTSTVGYPSGSWVSGVYTLIVSDLPRFVSVLFMIDLFIY